MYAQEVLLNFIFMKLKSDSKQVEIAKLGGEKNLGWALYKDEITTKSATWEKSWPLTQSSKTSPIPSQQKPVPVWNSYLWKLQILEGCPFQLCLMMVGQEENFLVFKKPKDRVLTKMVNLLWLGCCTAFQMGIPIIEWLPLHSHRKLACHRERLA